MVTLLHVLTLLIMAAELKKSIKWETQPPFPRHTLAHEITANTEGKVRHRAQSFMWSAYKLTWRKGAQQHLVCK